MILDRAMSDWIREFPIIKDLIELKETVFINPNKIEAEKAIEQCRFSMDDIVDVAKRWERFAPYLAIAFSDTKALNGIIESPIVKISNMHKYLNEESGEEIQGDIYLKCDSKLPISGSIKARGGIYEVLHFAESLAIEKGMLELEDDYSILAEDRFKELFSKYSIAVGSTGNLGLSIGIMAAKLGFKATVHMSADAKKWKKDMLRSKGVTVVEYKDDYSKAVSEGRKQAEADEYCYFVDDENSKTLFLGYSVAALRLKKQFEELGIKVDKEHPLFVYLPCGVGGGPGGVAFGIKEVFGDNAHCFFAEPTHSPCMILGLSTGYHDKICVQDFNIDNKTDADGLAVGRASSFVGNIMEPFISGSYTITDERMYKYLYKTIDLENIRLEPSALAGMLGPYNIEISPKGKDYIKKEGIKNMKNATHIVWATGGNLVPADIMEEYYNKGKNIK